MTYRFSHVPVHDEAGNTRNWEELQTLLNAGLTEAMLAAAVTAKLNPGAWVNPEGFNAKLEEHTTLQVRTEQGATVVRFKGFAKTKEEVPALSTLFTLPAAYRPKETIRLLGAELSTGVGLLVYVNATGVVENRTTLLAARFASFDGLTFNLT